MSRLVFRNRTGYPDAEVKQLVRFAFADLDLPRPYSILVRVDYTRVTRRRAAEGDQYGASGHAYNYVFVAPDVPAGAAYEVRLFLAKPDVFPTLWHDRARAPLPIGMLADWREALVAIAAHEGKHIEEYQARWRLGRKRGRADGHASEDRCDAYASGRVAAYRQAEAAAA